MPSCTSTMVGITERRCRRASRSPASIARCDDRRGVESRNCVGWRRSRRNRAHATCSRTISSGPSSCTRSRGPTSSAVPTFPSTTAALRFSAQLSALHRRVPERGGELLLRQGEGVTRERACVLAAPHLARLIRRVDGTTDQTRSRTRGDATACDERAPTAPCWGSGARGFKSRRPDRFDSGSRCRSGARLGPLVVLSNRPRRRARFASPDRVQCGGASGDRRHSQLTAGR